MASKLRSGFIISDLDKKIDKAVIKGLNKFAYYLHGKILDVTPLDTGELRRSISVREANEKNLEAEIVSSGAIAPYNVYVHEIPKTNYTTRGTGAKFMERPFEEEKHKIKDFITKEVKNDK